MRQTRRIFRGISESVGLCGGDASGTGGRRKSYRLERECTRPGSGKPGVRNERTSPRRIAQAVVVSIIWAAGFCAVAVNLSVVRYRPSRRCCTACSCFTKKIGCKSCNLDLHPIVRRRRDSNPRNVAVQQFSRLPPSTTRPHLHFSFLNRAAKIGIISKPAKLSEGADYGMGCPQSFQVCTASLGLGNTL